ncbi:MAG: tryptophan synthase subunit alpha [Spirochaetales bacterium]|uniref:Tryptophan synthase alpha chain n=1 Tax=Candidatus Thalassospirochaeta sargassi TaxID=3119039 RepID=A0AAJ1MNF6_9SPIO|nr:tryptophan synthase subunit alpha [Spirochaetales bacterium]
MMKDTAEKMKLVTHFIAGYPSLEASFDTAKGLIDGGAYALEMQMPFSDPSADGPVIESACRKALEAGFRVGEGFKLIERIKAYADVPLYVMSYSALVFNMVVQGFADRALAAGAAGLIIPDLTPGTDEGLYEAGRRAGIDVVPVVVPGVSDERLSEIMAEKPDWVYLALRSGITGSYTELDAENLGFLDRLKKYDAKIMAGFGICTPEQIETLKPHCDAAIAGSFIVNRLSEASTEKGGSGIMHAAKDAVEYLLGE